VRQVDRCAKSTQAKAELLSLTSGAASERERQTGAARKRLTLRGAPYKIDGVPGAAVCAATQFARIRKKAA